MTAGLVKIICNPSKRLNSHVGMITHAFGRYVRSVWQTLKHSQQGFPTRGIAPRPLDEGPCIDTSTIRGMCDVPEDDKAASGTLREPIPSFTQAARTNCQKIRCSACSDANWVTSGLGQ